MNFAKFNIPPIARAKSNVLNADMPEMKVFSEDGMIICALCSKTMNSEQQWDLHVNSKKHIKKVSESV